MIELKRVSRLAVPVQLMHLDAEVYACVATERPHVKQDMGNGDIGYFPVHIRDAHNYAYAAIPYYPDQVTII